MKTKWILVTIGLLTVQSSIEAEMIAVPDGSFEGISGNLTPPVALGTKTDHFGAWTISLTSLLSVGGSAQAGTAAAVSGPPAIDGANEFHLNIPASVLFKAELSQTLTNHYVPNSTYTLTVDLDQGTTAGLITETTLSLNAGDTLLATNSGAHLATTLDDSTGLQTVALAYKTGNTVPTNTISIVLNTSGAVGLNGDLYVDHFTLSVEPTQVQFSGVNEGDGTSFALVGTGGAGNATYEIATSTNLTALTPEWEMLATNHFDADGNFTQNIQIDPQTPQRFFRLLLP
jgi:hypothetical protein